MLAALSYDPLVRIEIGPLDLSPHGIGIAVGFLCGALVMLRDAEKKGISEDDVYSILLRVLVGSIVGARLAYVLNHFSDFESPIEILQVWKGGISLLGGIIGGIAAPCFWARKHNISFWKATDSAAPGLALGIVVGRIGDLIVGDHLGTPTSFFLGYLCPGANVETASPCPPGVVVHQTALYDLLLTAVLFGLLMWLRKRRLFDGALILSFGAIYGAQRLLEDFFREDVRRFGLTGSQWTAITFGLLCLFVLLVTRRTPRWGRWDERNEPAEVEEGPSPDLEAEIPDPESPGPAVFDEEQTAGAKAPALGGPEPDTADTAVTAAANPGETEAESTPEVPPGAKTGD